MASIRVAFASILWKSRRSFVVRRSLFVDGMPRFGRWLKIGLHRSSWNIGEWARRQQVFHRVDSCEVRVQLAHGSRKANVVNQGLLDLATSVQHGAVIASAEVRADLLQR